jgi:ABC-2 type transport system ATP-binding protein
MVGLSADKKRILKEYSKGMRQRIGLAQALINDPELVILDEPTSGLDPLGTRWMKDLIKGLRDQGKTVLMCSHRLEDVQDICDRIAILNEGELQELGKVSTLLQDVNRLEMQASGVKLTDELRRDLEATLQRHGGKLDSLGHPTTTLEDLFLRIVEESKAHPGRRYLPAAERPAAGQGDGETAPKVAGGR